MNMNVTLIFMVAASRHGTRPPRYLTFRPLRMLTRREIMSPICLSCTGRRFVASGRDSCTAGGLVSAAIKSALGGVGVGCGAKARRMKVISGMRRNCPSLRQSEHARHCLKIDQSDRSNNTCIRPTDHRPPILYLLYFPINCRKTQISAYPPRWLCYHPLRTPTPSIPASSCNQRARYYYILLLLLLQSGFHLPPSPLWPAVEDRARYHHIGPHFHI